MEKSAVAKKAAEDLNEGISKGYEDPDVLRMESRFESLSKQLNQSLVILDRVILKDQSVGKSRWRIYRTISLGKALLFNDTS